MSAETSVTDRRRAPRRQPALGTVLRLEPAAGSDTPRFGLVWNISSGGISVLFHESLSPGTTLRGELLTERGDAALAAHLRVCHSSQLQTGDYVLGCQFDRPLSVAELRPFVADPPASK